MITWRTSIPEGTIRRLGAGLAVAVGLGFSGPLLAQTGLQRDLVVRGLHFEGNHAIDDYTLSISIATSNSSWWARFPPPPLRDWLGEKRYFNELEFRRDVLRIQALYRLSGYLEARVDTLVRRTPPNVSVSFVITEGAPVRVTDIAVTGADSAISRQLILARIPFREGQAFSRFQLRASSDTIRSLLQDIGYPFAQVFAGYEEDSIQRSARVEFQVDPGRLSRISAVAVTGTNKVDPRVVRRAVGFRSGDVFSRKDLVETQRNLYRTDLFTYVNVGLVDSVRSSPDDSLVAIQVQVNEGKLNVVRAGAGYGTLDCFRGLAGWTGRNFFGGGRSLDLTGRLAKVASQTQLCPSLSGEDPDRRKLNYEATISLREPFLFSRTTSGSFSLFAERHSEFNTFTRISRGGEVSVTQLARVTLPVVLSYELTQAQTIADPAVFCTYLNVCLVQDLVFSAPHRESTLGLGFTWSRLNSVLNPSRGITLNGQLRYASTAIGSTEQRQFTKGTIELSAYEPLGRRGVLAWRVRLGALLPAKLGSFGGNAAFTPPDERLYLGGPNTVRGYGQNELGPLVRVYTGEVDTTIVAAAGGATDTTLTREFRTSPTGGDRLVLGNVELRVPLFGRFQGAVFVDAGAIYGGRPRAPDERLRVTPGVGIRFTTPIGPIRLDVGYRSRSPSPGPIYSVVGDELVEDPVFFEPPPPRTFFNHLQLHFSVGQPF